MTQKKDDKKKPQHLDDIFSLMEKEQSKSLDDAFKAHDAYSKEEHQNHLFTNILAPAQDDLYAALCSELDKSFESKDDTKIEKEEHKTKVKRATAKSLRKYFEKAHPSVVKAIDGLNMNEDEQYDYLTAIYDEHTGAGKIKGVNSLKEGIESLMASKKTIGNIKRHIYEEKAKHIEGALQILSSKYITHHFTKFHPHQIATYLKPQIEKAGFEIKDKVGYATASLVELLGLRKSVIEKEGYQYLTKKKDNKDKK